MEILKFIDYYPFDYSSRFLNSLEKILENDKNINKNNTSLKVLYRLRSAIDEIHCKKTELKFIEQKKETNEFFAYKNCLQQIEETCKIYRDFHNKFLEDVSKELESMSNEITKGEEKEKYKQIKRETLVINLKKNMILNQLCLISKLEFSIAEYMKIFEIKNESLNLIPEVPDFENFMEIGFNKEDSFQIIKRQKEDVMKIEKPMMFLDSMDKTFKSLVSKNYKLENNEKNYPLLIFYYYKITKNKMIDFKRPPGVKNKIDSNLRTFCIDIEKNLF